ncbi:MAG TPA: hypothetical protein VLC98_07855 [Phnomibacter sp.]|nr:hypothetical protein [Phnomibacter sp.]
MRKLLLLSLAVFPLGIFGQANVGIGTSTPKGALAIHSNSFIGSPDGAQLLLMEEEDDFARLRMTNMLHSPANNKFWDIAARISNGVPGSGDLMNFFLNGMGDVLTLNGLGNVGIGTTTPTSRLHVVSASAVPLHLQGGAGMYVPFYEGASYRGYIGSYAGNAQDMDFGTGSGNTTGKLHLTIQGSPELTIAENGYTGIGTTSPAWPLDVNGAMRINGRLVVNGTGGNAGQVLTSGGGVAAPSWTTLASAYDNNIRFSFTCSDPTNMSGNLAIGTRYNTNAAAVVVSGSNITFTTTGIYHFDMAISGRLDYASALANDPGFSINFYLSGGSGSGNNPVASTQLSRNSATVRYGGTVYAGTDLYITAGQVLNLIFSYGLAPGGFTEIDTFGYLRGYLINP